MAVVASVSLLLLTLTVPAADPKPGTAAGHDNYWQEIPDTGVRFPMVAVPGGTFHMGSPAREPGRRDDEGPRHRVELRPFWMGQFEVTWDEYHAYMREKDFQITDRPLRPALNPRQRAADAVTKPTGPYIDETHGYGKDRYPAFDMSHHAAMKYCEWLSIKTGRTYRLPTEAEWEYACRAGSSTAYPFGDKDTDLGQYAWYAVNSATDDHPRGATHPVGKKRPNKWGLQDMLGNVAEWCLDRYDAKYYGSLPADRTPFGPVNLPGKDRYPHVVRGGTFRSAAGDCRSSARIASHKDWNKADPGDPQSIWWLVPGGRVGFRVVLPVEEYPPLVGVKSEVTTESK
jgi:formylglycine-generating enzyme required for sulfatase activity